MSNLNNREIKIDEQKLRKMRFHIYTLEKDYYLKSKYTKREMKDKIREIIINEYKKNIGG